MKTKTPTAICIPLKEQQKLVLQALRFESAYYLETVPNLLKMFLGVAPVWMTGTDEGHGLDDHDCLLRARVRSSEEADRLQSFFQAGESHSESLGGHTEYYWEATVKMPGRLMIRENL